MKKLTVLLFACLLSLTAAMAQSDSTMFRAYLYNNEYDVYLRIDFHEENINVPGQDLYGPLPGYLGKKHNSFCWVITSAEVKDNVATIALINDYGSEDLTATLTCQNDSTYVLRQEKGSTLKVPRNGKWQKLPKTLHFKRGLSDKSR